MRPTTGLEPGHGHGALVYPDLLDLWYLVWTLVLVEQVSTGFYGWAFSAGFPKAKFVSRRLLVFQLPKPALPRLPASTAAALSVRQIVQPMTAVFITPMSICIAW
jgi:hypothetical protein